MIHSNGRSSALAAILLFIVFVSVFGAVAQADSLTKGKILIQRFDYQGVTLGDSPLKRQFDEVRDFYLRIPNDDLLKGYRQRAGLAAPGADLIALVKPQFEVGPQRVGKGGVVRDEAARRDALEGVRRFLIQAGWRVIAAVDSPVEGADGNREYLLHAAGPGA